MQKQFPLSERLWLDWLEDELKAATKPEAQAAITALFELAVQDYLSVAIWAKYMECAISLFARASRGETEVDTEPNLDLTARSCRCVTARCQHAKGSSRCRFLRDHDSDVRALTASGLDKFRSTAERALSAGGLHVTMGSQLWDRFRCAAHLQSSPSYAHTFAAHEVQVAHDGSVSQSTGHVR